MKINKLHTWDLTPKEAVALQKELADQATDEEPAPECRLIAGADVSYDKHSDTMWAAVVVLDAKDASIVETRHAVRDTHFPYVPGFLSFREAPALLEAFAQIESKVDAVLFDGQGMAHPRRFGIASHVGLWLDLPTVGCAKTRLIGEYKEPKAKRGSTSPLTKDDETIGAVVRTKDSVKPLYISPGHRIDLEGAVELTLAMSRGYRLPEPTRQAHLTVNVLRREGREA